MDLSLTRRNILRLEAQNGGQKDLNLRREYNSLVLSGGMKRKRQTVSPRRVKKHSREMYDKKHVTFADNELTLTLSPSPYVCPPPRGMDRWEMFWLRRDKPVVTVKDIINHFYSTAAGGYNRNVNEEMTWILKFIHEDLGGESYDMTMTFGEAEALREAKTLLDKYNALRTMDDVIEEKIRVQNEKFAYANTHLSPLLARMFELRRMTGYEGIMYRKKCLRSKSVSSSSKSKPAWHYHPASNAQKYSIRKYISGKMRQMIQECEIPFSYDDSITENANMESFLQSLTKGQASCIITKVKPRSGYSSRSYR